MSLYKRPLDDILASVTRLNKGVVLNESEYNFGQPQVVEPDSAGNNTTIHVSAKSNASAFEGEVTVSYKRLSLSDLATMLPSTIKANGITDVSKFAEVLNKYYGFAFVDGDLYNDPVSLPEGMGRVTLRAQPNSMGWIGEVSFNLEPGRADLANLAKVTTLTGLGYPNRSITKPFGEMLSYPNDFSAYYESLSLINKDNVSADDWTKIMNALKVVTGQTFVNNAPARYSLQNAVIDFNGSTADQPRANGNYGRVMLITLDETASLGLSGQLFLHYSEPDAEFD